MKIIENDGTGNFEIVADAYGTIRLDSKGSPYVYCPVPYARIPVGHNRSRDAARAIANYVCDQLNQIRDEVEKEVS